MSEATHFATALTEYFANPDNGAFASFTAATDGLTAAQAAAVPGERMNSVWAVVNHVWFWNEGPRRKLLGQAFEPADLGAPDWSGWPPAGDPSDEAAWQAARARAIDANAAFAGTS
jgi:DinB superfamily